MKNRANLNIKTLKGKLTNNRIKWYGHVLRMNEQRIPKKVFNMKVKGKYPNGRPRLRWEQQVRCHAEGGKEGRKNIGRN
jgi:hypothetical protein